MIPAGSSLVSQWLPTTSHAEGMVEALWRCSPEWAFGYRLQRRELEVQPSLIEDPHLADFAPALCPTAIDGYTVLRVLLAEYIVLLRDARNRGGDPVAMRAVWVNLRGGLVLDAPPWLERLEARMVLLREVPSPDAVLERCSLLHAACARARIERDMPPEMLTELQVCLAHALQFNPQISSHERFEMAATAYQSALTIYQPGVYPRQFARMHFELGRLWRSLRRRDEHHHLRRQVSAALAVMTPDQYPLHWGALHAELGHLYAAHCQDLGPLSRCRAQFHYSAALRIFTPQAAPSDHFFLRNAIEKVVKDAAAHANARSRR